MSTYQQEWHANNPGKNAEHSRTWRAKHPETEKKKKRKQNMKSRGYDISEEDYDAKVRLHDGECMICGSDNNGRTLHTDHNHETGKVRDLLCGPCNQAIGLMQEDPDRLVAASDYLRDHNV
jgi:hypothetical protein